MSSRSGFRLRAIRHHLLAAAPAPSATLEASGVSARSAAVKVVGGMALAGLTWKTDNPLSRPLIERLDTALDRLQGAEEINRNSPLTQGVWAPQLQEHNAVPMQVSAGQLPESLAGVFLRIGPNPANGPPSKKKYHLFDGDGMIHSIRMKDGKAWYSNAFVKTKRYEVEQKMKKEYFTRLGEMSGKVGLAKAVLVMGRKEAWHDMTTLDAGPANTHTVCFDGDVYALTEGNYPFEVRIAENGSITSHGFTTFEGELDFPFSAHPKVDDRKQQLVFHGYSIDPSMPGPLYKLGVRSAGKPKLDSYTPIEISGRSFNHDMAITENFAVLLDSSIRFDVMRVLDDQVMSFDQNHRLRLGLQPRAANKDETQWFEADSAMAIVHVINAFEENGEVVLQAPATYSFKSGLDFTKDVEEGQNVFKIYEFRMDLNDANRRIRVKLVGGSDSYHTAEFPRTREDLVGYPTRFAYTARSEGGTEHGGFDFRGLVKFDFKDMDIAAQITFPGQCVGGDPMFIARGAEEDDGFLAVIVYDPEREHSTLNIYDAQTFDSAPVAVLDCPKRVPMGFHANFMTESQLQAHLAKHGHSRL